MLRELNYQEIVPRIVGATLIDAKYVIHSFEGSLNNIIAVIMEFSNLKAIIFRCGSDGESLIISQEEPQEADLDEAGRIQLISAEEVGLAPLHFPLSEVAAGVVIELKGNIVKSIRIIFNKSSIFIANIGDDLGFDENRFRQMIMEEEAEPLTVVSF